MLRYDIALLERAAGSFVEDFLRLSSEDEFLITADLATDREVVDAVVRAATRMTSRLSLLTIPQLPFQGALADPYVPAALSAATQNCDVWVDMTFPYLAGAKVHADAVAAGRVRSVWIGDLDASAFSRLYGYHGLDDLFDLQLALDKIVAGAVGKTCRVTCPLGTDVSFVIGPSATKKVRRLEAPGSVTTFGSCPIYPDIETVRGKIVLGASFHEHFVTLRHPIVLEVDGEISRMSGGGAELVPMSRALHRASGGKSLGSVIHFSIGFHPAARLRGQSFVEDVRVPGSNAIGFGIPWWQEGGGENHPDGVVANQSLWIDGEQIMQDGVIVGPAHLVELSGRMPALQMAPSPRKGAGGGK